MEFIKFKTAVKEQFEKMKGLSLFRVNVDGETLKKTYLNSFPAGSDKMFRERTQHNCTTCLNFVKNIGGVVTISHGKLVSIWDITCDEPAYQAVADALSELVKSSTISDKFFHESRGVGVDKSYEERDLAERITWEHFHVVLPTSAVRKNFSIATSLATVRDLRHVMKRGLAEISLDAIDTVLDLIAQNSIYRGEEFKNLVERFRELKVEFDSIPEADRARDIWAWSRAENTPDVLASIRNSMIGTLLTDISEGKSLESSVKAYETKAAPANYKRPTALVSKAQVEKAKKAIEELGLIDSLERRFAKLDDISINNILFADRSARKNMKDVFDDIADLIPTKTKNLDKVEEITIEDFIANVLPKAESIEVAFSNAHTGNLVSLITAAHPDAPNLVKWDNPFTWTYQGDVADSIKERVKAQGGAIEGDLRVSLSWFNYDDLDLHVTEQIPSQEHLGKHGHTREVYYADPTSPIGGHLDVDMNRGCTASRSAVENIVYKDKNRIPDGTVLEIRVHNYNKRESIDVGFTIEIEFGGVTHTLNYTSAVGNDKFVPVATVIYSKGNFAIVDSIPSTASSKEVWGIQTEQFHKVNVIMNSPNHWDDQGVGNKHYFFMIDECKNDGKARGFYNEFLKPELDQYRKVLELVGAKMKTEESEHQLSGLGFSSTQRNTLLVKVKGSFNRTLKVLF